MEREKLKLQWLNILPVPTTGTQMKVIKQGENIGVLRM
jgi:hypothetical protein